MAFEIKDDNFEDLLKEGKPVVVDFWAPWCGPCKQIAPIIEDLAKEYEGKVVVGKCDVDNNTELAARFGIRNIPTILFIKDGEVQEKHVGASQKADLKNKIDALL